MDDKLRELYSLASKALECQADFGHNEIILESPLNLSNQETYQSMNGNSTQQQGDAQMTKTIPKDKLEKTIPDYGPIPDLTQDTGLNDDSNTKNGTEFSDPDAHCAAISDCQKCSLGKTRTKFVYGVGNPKAKIMFIGEAPGRDEDLKGEPFVGRAGKLLDKIIAAMGFGREEIYIANILKCRPPKNRDPQPDEMNLCMPYLKEQIHLIKPQFICALGRIAVQGLLDTNAPLGSLRKKWHRFEGIPFLATYHPAALLRFAKYKKDTWEDMQVLMKEYEQANNGNK